MSIVICNSAYAMVEMSLNGKWKMQYSKSEDKPAPDRDFITMIVPSHIAQKEEPYAWYKHSFMIPFLHINSNHVFLRFGGVKFVSEIYVNGKHVGGHYGGWEPFELEIIDACKFDQGNELLVRVTDVRGLFDGDVEYKPGRDLIEQKKRHVMAQLTQQNNNLLSYLSQ